jgi:hypothetical protein
MPFKKGISGNPEGKPKGARNEKTLQWEALGESIVGMQAENFNTYLQELWAKEDTIDKQKAADLYLKVLAYFKPMLSRAELSHEIPEDGIVFKMPNGNKS